MSQFLNSKENAVTEAIDGVLVASGGALSRLDGYPHIRVVVRSDWDRSKVAIVSGTPASWNSTLPGASRTSQAIDRDLPAGLPSSLTLPARRTFD